MDSKRTIPFFDYPALYNSRDEDFQKVIKDVLSRGAYILQKDLEDFEKHIAEYINVKHAIGVANCTDALIMALQAAGLENGDEVIISSHTFVATAAAVHFAGGITIPVECGEDHQIDPNSIESEITNRTKCIMPTQLNGRICKMDAVQKIADKHGLFIIEDSAQGLGSKYKGHYAGTFGLAGAFSFYPAKILGCFGDGGMVVTDDNDIAEKVLLLRDHGRNYDGEVVDWGGNSRLDNFHAAILDYQFGYYEETINRRREIASLYQEELKNVSEILLPPAPENDSDHFDTYQNYEIEAERRDELKEFFKESGIGTLIQWGGTPVHMLNKLGFSKNLPKTEKVFDKCLLLPMNPYLSDADIKYIADKIREFYNN